MRRKRHLDALQRLSVWSWGEGRGGGCTKPTTFYVTLCHDAFHGHSNVYWPKMFGTYRFVT